MKFHFWSGYAILTLLLFRIAWGFVGSTTARFSDFVKGPAAGIRPLRDCCAGSAREVGHNPLGGAMVVVLLFAVLAQVVAGMFSADTDTGTVTGPLAHLVADKWIERATAFHHFWVNVLLILVGLHVAGGHRLSGLEAAEPDRRHDHGHKPSATVVPPGRPRHADLRLGPAGGIVADRCAAIVYFIVRLGG